MGATTWEMLAGDTSVFAVKFALIDNPDPNDCAPPEEARSWGGFQLWVDGINLCAHTEAGETLQYAHWYLMPLLEWLVENWDPLFHEERLPRNVASQSALAMKRARVPPARLDEVAAEIWEERWSTWWERHSLQAARAGGLFPDVYLRRRRDQLEVAWEAAELAGAPAGYAFVATGGVRRPPVEVACQALYKVVRECVLELQNALPDSERIEVLAAASERLAEPSRAAARLGLLAGLGPVVGAVGSAWDVVGQGLSELPQHVRERLVGAAEGLVVSPAPQATALFGTVAPNVEADDVAQLTAALVASAEEDEVADPADLDSFRTELARLADLPPWDQGNELASVVHERFSLADADGFVDVSPLVEHLGVAVRDIELTDHSIRGLALVSSLRRPLIFVNTAYTGGDFDEVRRFTLAHEACHLLVDRELGRPLAIASGSWAPRDIEQRANAFAAALLMPLDLMRAACLALLGDEQRVPDSFEELDPVAKVLRISPVTLTDRFYNLELIDRDLWAELRSVSRKKLSQRRKHGLNDSV